MDMKYSSVSSPVALKANCDFLGHYRGCVLSKPQSQQFHLCASAGIADLNVLYKMNGILFLLPFTATRTLLLHRLLSLHCPLAFIADVLICSSAVRGSRFTRMIVGRFFRHCCLELLV